MYAAERWTGGKHPDKAIACDTLTEARVMAIGLMTRVGQVITITRTTRDRMYDFEEVVCKLANKFSDRTGRFTAGYEYIVKKRTPRGPEYFYISKKTGRSLGKAYGVSGFF